MTLPGWRVWLFSLKAYLAACIALYVALWIDLPRPYWSVITVYVVSQPFAGTTLSKGLYRLAGTVLGAAGAVLPQIGDGEAGGGQGRGAGDADTERGGQDRIGAAGEADRVGASGGQAGAGQDGAERVARHFGISPCCDRSGDHDPYRDGWKLSGSLLDGSLPT